jgi:hypothetical protein
MPARRRSSSKKVAKSSPKPRVVRRTRKVATKSPTVRRTRKATRKATKSPRKPVNKWVMHVMKESKSRGITYSQALRDPKTRQSYKP